MKNLTNFVLHGDAFYDAEGNAIASKVIKDGRYQWNYSLLGVDQCLIAAASIEADIYKTWALQQNLSASDSQHQATMSEWFLRHPCISSLLSCNDIPFSLTNKVVLDIGGCGKDSKYFISDQPDVICQVEVSPESQAIFRSRFGGEFLSGPTEFQLHTCPAEILPFRDSTFDFIFSRATIHHCRRPKVFHEVLRVASDNSTIIITKNYKSPFLRVLMKVIRRFSKRNYGSDNPLSRADISYFYSLLLAERFNVSLIFDRSILEHPFLPNRLRSFFTTLRSKYNFVLFPCHVTMLATRQLP